MNDFLFFVFVEIDEAIRSYGVELGICFELDPFEIAPLPTPFCRQKAIGEVSIEIRMYHYLQASDDDAFGKEYVQLMFYLLSYKPADRCFARTVAEKAFLQLKKA